MNLDQQIESLIQNAPQDGRTPELIRAIAPSLKKMAQQLQHLQYYILQSPQEQWLTTTLSNRNQPQQEKTVIYAYANPHQAKHHAGLGPKSQDLTTLSIPTIHILFQLLALQPVDSLLFFEDPENLQSAIEVDRQEVQNLIKTQLQLYQREKRSGIPRNLA
jgi:hypothetical protein